MELVIQHGPDAMAAAFATLLNHAMGIERGQVLGAQAHQRSPDRRGHATPGGFKPKTLTTRLGRIPLQIPQTRNYHDEHGNPFYPKALTRGVRSERALTLAIAEMYVQGVSTRKVTAVLEQLCGLEVTSMQVSRAAQELDHELEAWRTRPLGEVRYLILDARYEKVRHGGSVVSCALLTAIGVLPSGKRSILGCSVSLSEAEIHWRTFLQSLLDRGMHSAPGGLVVSDDHAGLGAARQAVLPGAPWQRCQFHLMQNAMAYVPKIAMRSEVAQGMRRVFNADDRQEAERHLGQLVDEYRDTAPRLAAWLEENVPEGLAIFAFPAGHRKRLRTTNGQERLNKEIKRRTRVATLFPNEASLLRLASAVLSETSDEWEPTELTSTWKPDDPPIQTRIFTEEELLYQLSALI